MGICMTVRMLNAIVIIVINLCSSKGEVHFFYWLHECGDEVTYYFGDNSILSLSFCGWLSKIHQFVKLQDVFENREFTEISFHVKS